MSSGITEFLKEKVYPEIDAVEAGLLDHLKPSGSSSAGAYQLNCPACGENRAFYYIGNSVIQCNRRNNCKSRTTSIWDALEKTGMSGREIVTILCAKARVEPPEFRPARQGQRPSPATSSGKPTDTQTMPTKPGTAIFKVTQQLASVNQAILKKLQADRGYSDADMAAMRLGVYTTAKQVLAGLEALGVTKEVARSKGYIGYDDARPDYLYEVMDGRVVGYWPHEDGDVRLWGRIPAGDSTEQVKKYRFTKSLIKDIPYLFSKRHGSMPICVEGTLDAWALQLLGHWGTAIGQASINPAQAVHMVSKGVIEAAHLVDGDVAGYDGAIASIRACESVGITLSIIVLGSGMDDADAMRRDGKSEQLVELIRNRMNAGQYLAHYCAAHLSKPTPDLRAVAYIRGIAKNLTPTSMRYWKDFAMSLNVYVDEEAEAIRVLSGLVAAGMPVGESLRQVQRRTGHIITIQKEDHIVG